MKPCSSFGLGKYGSDIASIVFIVVGVAAIVFFLNPP